MSSTLYMRPAPLVQPKAVELPYELKRTIAKRFWDHDGTLTGSEVRLEGPLFGSTMAYLEGLVDAGVEGAEDLRTAVIQHGAVTIWIA